MTTSTSASLLKPSLTIKSSSHSYEVEFPSVGSLENWQPEADLLLVDAYFRGQLAEDLDQRAIYRGHRSGQVVRQNGLITTTA